MQVDVTQEDRDAAADLLNELSSLLDHVGIGQVSDLIRDGEYDEHDTCQAFARHRQAAERRALERAAEACEDQQRSFLSPEYATNQPLSSFGERFACGQCAQAIRALIEERQPKAPIHDDNCEAMQRPRADCTCIPKEPPPTPSGSVNTTGAPVSQRRGPVRV